MRKLGFSKCLFALMLVLSLALAACSGNNTDGDAKEKPGDKKENTAGKKDAKSEDGTYSIEDFSMDKTNQGEAIENGELNYGVVAGTSFKGTLNYNFYQDTYDAQFIKWFDEPLFDTDENYMITNDGAATYEVSDDGLTFTLKIKDGVNWQDGEPVTAEDWAFAYEVLGHKDTAGIRYGADFENVVGMKEYHEGKADSISGIEIVDDKTLKITHYKTGPSMYTGGIWSYALPKHIFKDIPIKDMAASDAVRKNPIGIGPYKVESIVPGESVTYVKNEDYWRGEPKLDKVTAKIVSPSTVIKELESGKVDMVDSFPAAQFPDVADMSNVEWLGQVDNSFTYIGFKLGHFDKKKDENVMDPDKKMSDVNLRRAMWYAIDNDAVGKKFYNGLRWNATTLIIPFFKDFHDDSIKTPTYDPDEAKKILDEAGYKDVDGDGFRETPEGEKLVINFASMSGDDTAQPLANYYIQSWKNVGLKVELLDGKLHELNSFYDRLEADDPKIDIYQAAWGTGTDVNPEGIHGRKSSANYTRFTSEKADDLYAKGNSKEAADIEYRKRIYSEWQQLMVDEIPMFPTVYRAALIPVNNRVINYSIDPASDLRLYDIAVTQDKPFVDKK
ncbi:oligopeptide ABC transporter substrate-binding protein [Lederbergia sp. NSJ-179]|uniref:oligopeptide ABC transporter substrate-binding protein n=1 Tax=Lederbergia sp. NSJ-179 TaxID=2931402 RepID=UPI001FD54D06|nr:oligopeptide ABC transporter substrate-binding protein [Lederbergia sp. NSJ-179]MCJ7840285.1 oligopeptide ABC transporter substrate-binding protein [Lederbergia sp. NSJ-179]